jgi:DNA polymerase III epsilon subunit-like protein
MLFSHGIKPGIAELAERLGVDTSRYRSDHALDDARRLREIYLRAVREPPVHRP